MATTTQLEETLAFNAALERQAAGHPSAADVPLDLVRRAQREGRATFPPITFLPEARDLDIPTRAGSIKARLILPDAPPTGVYLHLHGGGWTIGEHDLQDPLLRGVADETGMAALSVGYRLAPEHPYPAAPDDCEDAALWLLDRGAAELGVPARFAIGGESAGAHLSAVTLLRLRDRHGVRGAFSGANLVFGVYDVTMTPSQRRWGDRNLILSTPLMHWFADNFLGDRDPEARRDPDISPLYADLRDLPPALFQVGTADPLLDDSLFMEARWRTAGGDTRIEVYEEAAHGFTAFDIGVSVAARRRQHEFLRSL